MSKTAKSSSKAAKSGKTTKATKTAKMAKTAKPTKATKAPAKSAKAAAPAEATQDKLEMTETAEPQVILVTTKFNGEKARATLSHEDTNICYKTRGDWHSDSYYSEPLSVLVAQGIYKPANTRARKMFADFYGQLGQKQMDLLELQERTTEFSRQVLGEEPAPEALKADENAILSPADRVALKMDEQTETAKQTAEKNAEDTEAALWEQVEQEKEADEEIAAMVAEYPAATGATPEVPDELPQQPEPKKPTAAPRTSNRVPVCQIILNGETEPQPIPADIQLKPGMKLVRKFRERIIEVIVEPVGFTYNGTTYPTLTHVSWMVSPYKIAGNTFFGLPVKKRAAKH